MTATKSVTWLPTHPAMGWVSMNRCWNALREQSQKQRPDDLLFRCPLELLSVEQKGLGRLGRAWKRSVEYPGLIRSGPVTDVYHVLDHSFADLLRWVPKGARTAVTVHDVIPLNEPDQMTLAQQRRFRNRVSHVVKADRVICVSHFTRSTLLKEFDLDPSRVIVIPNGADVGASSVSDAMSPFPEVEGIKLLLVGSVLKRKNLRLIPRLIAELRKRGTNVNLLRIGQMLPPDLKQKMHEELGEGGSLLELGHVSDSMLRAAYKSADTLIFPSTHEGFGLPVLEAMAEGCPVISSNAASLPEVGGDAVLYFDPHDAAQAADACVRLMSDRGMRQTMRNRGLERSTHFTWAKHWDQLCEVYRELAMLG